MIQATVFAHLNFNSVAIFLLMKHCEKRFATIESGERICARTFWFVSTFNVHRMNLAAIEIDCPNLPARRICIWKSSFMMLVTFIIGSQRLVWLHSNCFRRLALIGLHRRRSKFNEQPQYRPRTSTGTGVCSVLQPITCVRLTKNTSRLRRLLISLLGFAINSKRLGHDRDYLLQTRRGPSLTVCLCL